jgi:hypothetical protein
MGDAVGIGDAGVGAGGTGVGSGGAEVGAGTDVGDEPGSPHPQPLAEKPTNITTKSNGMSFFIIHLSLYIWTLDNAGTDLSGGSFLTVNGCWTQIFADVSVYRVLDDPL